MRGAFGVCAGAFPAGEAVDEANMRTTSIRTRTRRYTSMPTNGLALKSLPTLASARTSRSLIDTWIAEICSATRHRRLPAILSALDISRGTSKPHTRCFRITQRRPRESRRLPRLERTTDQDSSRFFVAHRSGAQRLLRTTWEDEDVEPWRSEALDEIARYVLTAEKELRRAASTRDYVAFLKFMRRRLLEKFFLPCSASTSSTGVDGSIRFV